jgi:hypothetical protein
MAHRGCYVAPKAKIIVCVQSVHASLYNHLKISVKHSPRKTSFFYADAFTRSAAAKYNGDPTPTGLIMKDIKTFGATPRTCAKEVL